MGVGVRLGVLGGTFDPVHIGHLVLAETARDRLALDKVLFVPAGVPWFKLGRELTPAHHRLEMVRRAVGSKGSHFAVSEIEVARPGPSYTVDTLDELTRSQGEEAELFVVLGTDALNELARWKEPDRVLSLATLVTMARPGHRGVAVRALDAIRQGASATVVEVEGPVVGVSGSDIRERVSRGRSIKYLVPEAVESYIREHGLYTMLGAPERVE